MLLLCGCTRSTPAAAPTTSSPPAEVLRPTVESTVPIVAPEPTGVPGLDAPDPFCATWATYVGTLQALGTAAAFGGIPPAAFVAIEMAASPRLIEVAAAIDASWPSELAAEQTVVIEQKIGPFARRAQRAVDALRAAGVSAEQLTTLSAAWQAALRGRDPGSPVIALEPVADDLQAKVDAAGRAFDAAATPYADDPSLVVDTVATPLTSAYLAAHCPDLAASGVGDAV